MFRGVTLAIAAALVGVFVALKLQRAPTVYSVRLRPVAGEFAENELLLNTRSLNTTADRTTYVDKIKGAENIAYDERTGAVYTGSADGKLWRIEVSTSQTGEPLVNAEVAVDLTTIDANSRLRGFVLSREQQPSSPEENDGGQEEELVLTGCDASLGLIQIRQLQNNRAQHEIVQLTPPPSVATTTESSPPLIHFCNSVIKGETGFFITDSHGPNSSLLDSLFTFESTGRLLFFETLTKKLYVIKEGLSFPNGLWWKERNQKLIVGETVTLTLWEVDVQSNNWKVFSGLPVAPDNIHDAKFGDDRNGMVVAGTAAARNNLKDKLFYESTLLRKLSLALLPARARSWAVSTTVGNKGVAAWLSPRGEITKILYAGNIVAGLSSTFVMPGGIQVWGSYLPTQSLVLTAITDL